MKAPCSIYQSHKFGDPRDSDSRDILFLICHKTLPDQMFKGYVNIWAEVPDCKSSPSHVWCPLLQWYCVYKDIYSVTWPHKITWVMDHETFWIGISILCHHPAKVGGRWYWSIEDMVLFCHVTLKDHMILWDHAMHVIRWSYDFLSGNLLK